MNLLLFLLHSSGLYAICAKDLKALSYAARLVLDRGFSLKPKGKWELFGVVAFVWAAFILIVVSVWVIVSMSLCRRCKRYSWRSRRLGRREILKQLLHAEAPHQAWYEIKMLCLREGVQTDIEEGLRPRWHGVRLLASENELFENFKDIFKLGRSSLLRDMRAMGDGAKDWVNLLKIIEEKDLDLDAVIFSEPPAYFDGGWSERQRSQLGSDKRYKTE